jgi:6-pyruvoyl-tetrahydropterin synthase
MASKAVHRNKPYRDVARENIQIGVCLAIIDKVDKKLMAEHEQMDLATVPALKLLCDNQWRKLAKVLPDLKQVEHKGEVTSHVIVKFNP